MSAEAPGTMSVLALRAASSVVSLGQQYVSPLLITARTIDQIAGQSSATASRTRSTPSSPLATCLRLLASAFCAPASGCYPTEATALVARGEATDRRRRVPTSGRPAATAREPQPRGGEPRPRQYVLEHATPRVRVIGGRKRSLSRSMGPVHGRSGGKRLAETSCANVLLERPDNYSP
jgi:hypothetical protein